MTRYRANAVRGGYIEPLSTVLKLRDMITSPCYGLLFIVSFCMTAPAILVPVSDSRHSLPNSLSGCQCVSACRPSVYREAPWCHVKQSLCNPSNTIKLDDSSFLNPNISSTENDATDDPPASLSSLTMPSSYSSSPLVPPIESSNARDIFGHIGVFVENFLSLVAASASQNRRRLQESEISECRCRQDVVGVWDFCDPSRTKKTTEEYSEYDLPPFSSISYRSAANTSTTTTREPLPLLLLRDDPDSTVGNSSGNNENTITSYSEKTGPKSLRHRNESQGEKNLSDQPVASSAEVSRTVNAPCHPSCQTCTKGSKGLETECLTCFDRNDGFAPGIKYHLVALVGRSNRQIQGRCVPITNDPDFCHNTCKECRADCCAKSQRACVSCPKGSPFRSGPHKTVGQCLPILRTPFTEQERFDEIVPNVPQHLQNRDWNGLIKLNASDGITKHIEGNQDRVAVEELFPFSESLHPAVSSWLLRESHAESLQANHSQPDITAENGTAREDDSGELGGINHSETRLVEEIQSERSSHTAPLSSHRRKKRQKTHTRSSTYDGRTLLLEDWEVGHKSNAKKHQKTQEKYPSFSEENNIDPVLIESDLFSTETVSSFTGKAGAEIEDRPKKIYGEKQVNPQRGKNRRDGQKKEVEGNQWNFKEQLKTSISLKSKCNDVAEYLRQHNPGVMREEYTMEPSDEVRRRKGLSDTDSLFDYWWNRRPLLTESATAGKRYWTQLVYLHADNNILEAALADLSEMRHPVNPQQFENVMNGDHIKSSSVADYMHLVVLIDTKKQSISDDNNMVDYVDENGIGTNNEYSLHGDLSSASSWGEIFSFSQIRDSPIWSMVNSSLDWLFGKASNSGASDKDVENSGLQDVKKAATQADELRRRRRSIVPHDKHHVMGNQSRRTWTTPGSEWPPTYDSRRRLGSHWMVSKHLGDIVICPDLPFTDGTTAKDFNPDSGEAYELYRIPRNFHGDKKSQQPYDWLLLRKCGEVRTFRASSRCNCGIQNFNIIWKHS